MTILFEKLFNLVQEVSDASFNSNINFDYYMYYQFIRALEMLYLYLQDNQNFYNMRYTMLSEKRK